MPPVPKIDLKSTQAFRSDFQFTKRKEKKQTDKSRMWEIRIGQLAREDYCTFIKLEMKKVDFFFFW
jgi:hypothetical protein